MPLADALVELQELTERLRRDCPWDREQTARTIVPHTVEEAYELADAAGAGDDAKLLDELGDLLFHVYFLALLLEDPDRFRGRTVVLVVSGGNIDPRLLASVILRGLGRQSRLVRFLVDAEDAPGRLAALATVIGRAGANIVEVEHGRLTSDLAVRRARVSFVLETLDAAHADQVEAALLDAGFVVERRDL